MLINRKRIYYNLYYYYIIVILLPEFVISFQLVINHFENFLPFYDTYFVYFVNLL
jgi:hypothetical protein